MPNLPLGCRLGSKFALAAVVKKLLKRLLTAVAGGLGAVVLFCSVGLILFKHTPGWYKIPALTAEEFEAAAQRVANKLAQIQNEAGRIRVAERAQRSNPAATTRAPATRRITVSFTDHELNAFFNKWAAFNNWKAGYERYITDPVVILNDGRIILAARVRDLDTVASLHFESRIDEQGQLRLDLVRILGGHLPLPEALFGNYRDRLVGAIRQRIPRWSEGAAIDRSGTPNTNAVRATMATLLLDVMAHEPADPVLFLPLVEHGSVAVRTTDVRIENHTLTLTVQPLTSGERADLLRRLKETPAATHGP